MLFPIIIILFYSFRKIFIVDMVTKHLGWFSYYVITQLSHNETPEKEKGRLKKSQKQTVDKEKGIKLW